MVEKYPSLLNWQASRKDSLQRLLPGSSDGPGYALMTKGVIGRSHCHASCVYLLNWPEDAWWQWQIRGKVLYAGIDYMRWQY